MEKQSNANNNPPITDSDNIVDPKQNSAMSGTPDRLASVIRRVLKEELRRSPAMRDLLVELADLVLAEADASGSASREDRVPSTPFAVNGDSVAERHESSADQAITDTNAEVVEAADELPEDQVTGMAPLTLAGSVVHVEVKDSAAAIAGLKQAAAADDNEPQQEAPKLKPIDLGLVEERARLKAESCRFFIELRRDRDDPVREPALRSRMDEMIATAKSMSECFLWVFWQNEEQPEDDRLLRIATCYDALAEGAALCRRAIAPDGRLSSNEMQQAFQLFAEASSALRKSLDVTWLTSDDNDQEEAHTWLRRASFNRGVFVERYMKLDDPALPEYANEVITEAKRLILAEEDRVKKARKVDQLLNKAAYHARRVRNDTSPVSHDFETINAVMEELRINGIGPTDARVVEFREGIEGIEFPANLPRHEHLTFESKSVSTQSLDQSDQWNDRVTEARALLENGRIVIIGGEPRQDAIGRMESAFGASIEWVELTEHGSGARIQAPIERPDTRIVLLLIKLIGHLHADEARAYSRAAGVPFVNVEAGHNPNMVAEQVMAQAGERLSVTAGRESDSD